MASDDGLPLKHISNEGLDLLRRYSWPGNVRELENLVRRLAALYPQEEIAVDVIETELKNETGLQEADNPVSVNDNITIGEAVEMNMQKYFASFGNELPPAGLYHRVLEEVEYPLILACLTATKGNQIKAAELLGLNRNTLRKKVRDLKVNIYKGTKAN